jgi:hypothetical protein
VARLPDLEQADAVPAIAKVMQAQLDEFGYVFNATKMLGYCPEVSQAAASMGRALDRENNIEAPLRFLLYSRVAMLNACPF